MPSQPGVRFAMAPAAMAGAQPHFFLQGVVVIGVVLHGALKASCLMVGLAFALPALRARVLCEPQQLCRSITARS